MTPIKELTVLAATENAKTFHAITAIAHIQIVQTDIVQMSDNVKMVGELDNKDYEK